MSALGRFTSSERARHWVFAAGWLGRLASAPPGGHLFLALVFPATRPSLHGMLRGRVDAGWAARHHPRWPGEPPPEDRAA